MYWTNVAFGPHDTVLVTLVNRGQDHLALTSFDAKTGEKLGTLLTEHDRQWVEPEHPPQFLRDGKFLWRSRRSGYRHVYLHEPSGERIRQVTSGDFDVLALLQVEADERRLWFEAAGDDPRQLHLFVASLADGSQRKVTKERGSHQVDLAPDAKLAHVFFSNLETKPSARVLDTTTAEGAPLPQPNNPLDAYALPKQRCPRRIADGLTSARHCSKFTRP